MYFSYYKRGVWQKYNPHPFPEIIFICAEKKTFNFLNVVIKNKLKKESRIIFSLTTQDAIRKYGISKKVLQKVEI